MLKYFHNFHDYLAISGSLTLPAIYGVVLMVSTLLSSPYLGAWIDLTHRLTAATIMCVVHSVAVTLSSVALSLYLHWQDYLITSQVFIQTILGGLAPATCLLISQLDGFTLAQVSVHLPTLLWETNTFLCGKLTPFT